MFELNLMPERRLLRPTQHMRQPEQELLNARMSFPDQKCCFP
jgi:hypothetical protein